MNALEQFPRRTVLLLLFRHFFLIALCVVGGGYAIILAAEEIFVRKLRWLKEGELFEMLTVIQTVPGLTAGNAAIYVGYRSAGQIGALVSLIAVALPSYIVICLVALGFNAIPMENVYVQGAFIGVRTALCGLTLAAVIRFWPKAVVGRFGLFAMALTFVLVAFVKINLAIPLLTAVAFGIARGILRTVRRNRKFSEAGTAELFTMFLLFLWFGVLCIGGGSVLMPLYIQELVDARQWLGRIELNNLAAISQVTPGPIGVNLATFLGFRHGGAFGALLCTAGLLLPSYLLMMAALRSLHRWNDSPVVRGIMETVAPVTLGLMAATMLIYLECSLFTAEIPWRYLLELGIGRWHAYEGPFRICIGAIPVLLASCWLLYRNKCSIMCAIFSSAAYGALLCRG